MGSDDIVVDYHKQSLYDVVPNRSVDLVFDNLGRPGDVEKAMSKLKSPGGTFISIVTSTVNGSSHPPPGNARKMNIIFAVRDHHILVMFSNLSGVFSHCIYDMSGTCSTCSLVDVAVAVCANQRS